jgi:phosphoribosylaminoimidazole-succinocarboxamide synthase
MNRQELLDAIPDCLIATDLRLDAGQPAAKYMGKVRDTYDLGDGRLVLVTTDRQSGFDRLLGAIPFKGQVLNRTSLYWFDQTREIVANHVLASPHANALIARKCRVLPIEFVVRGFMTGSTDTAIWTQYATTKETRHDRPIAAEEIVAEGWLGAEQWEFCSAKALELFAFGQRVAAERGLILVDTKYEFGVTENGEIILVDEIHTPDSSRYWLAESYTERLSAGREPEMIDKEFFRLWFRERCDPYADEVLPVPPAELIAELAARYIQLFEKITGSEFAPDPRPLEASIVEGVGR